MCVDAGAQIGEADAQRYRVTHSDIEIQTEHSGRIGLRVSYAPDARGTFPLVVFSHGNYLTNTAYTALTDRWVKSGFFVVAPQHMDTGDRQAVQALTEKVGSDWIAVARVLDMKSVLNQIAGISESLDQFEGEVNTDHVVAAGHSFGALTAQWLGGATLEKRGNSIYPIPDTLSDSRVAAVVAISPPGLIPGVLSTKTWSGFSKPQLVVTGTEDTFEFIWPDYRSHLVSYESALPGHGYALVLDGMDHYMGGLIGRLEQPGPPQRDALENVVDISLLFMRRYLFHDGGGALTTPLEDKEATAARHGIIRFERR
ncbi:MAG: alpha/beta hydrolase family protein [Gammaproteobacteria bacterium]